MASTKEELNGFVRCCKYFIVIFNIISLLVGITVFSLTMWVRFNDEMVEYINTIDVKVIWAGTGILAITSFTCIILSIIGFCGAFYEKPGWLFIYGAVMVITVIVEIVGCGIILAYGLENSALSPLLVDKMYVLIDRMDYDSQAKRVIDLIQEKIHCCGALGTNDYYNYHKHIPDSCRDHSSGNDYKIGCAQAFAAWFESHSGAISGLTLVLVLGQIIVIWSAFQLRRAVLYMKGNYKAVSPRA